MRRAGPVVPSPWPKLPDLDVPGRAALFPLVLIRCLAYRPHGRRSGAGAGLSLAVATGRSALRRSCHSSAGMSRGAGAGSGLTSALRGRPRGRFGSRARSSRLGSEVFRLRLLCRVAGAPISGAGAGNASSTGGSSASCSRPADPRPLLEGRNTIVPLTSSASSIASVLRPSFWRKAAGKASQPS